MSVHPTDAELADDSELLAMLYQLTVLAEAEERLIDALPDDVTDDEVDAAFAPLASEGAVIEECIAKLGAPVTTAGVEAMALAALALATRESDGTPIADDISHRLALLVAESIAGRAST